MGFLILGRFWTLGFWALVRPPIFLRCIIVRPWAFIELGLECLLDLGHHLAISAIEFRPRLIRPRKGRVIWPFTLGVGLVN